MQAAGWYRDPYLVHEDRWFSGGQATKLVRDGGIEHYDLPPDDAPGPELVQAPNNQPSDGSDLRRADDSSTWDRDDVPWWKALWWMGSYGDPELDFIHGLFKRLRQRERR